MIDTTAWLKNTACQPLTAESLREARRKLEREGNELYKLCASNPPVPYLMDNDQWFLHQGREEEKSMTRERYKKLLEIAESVCQILEHQGVKKEEACIVRELADRLWDMPNK